MLAFAAGGSGDRVSSNGPPGTACINRNARIETVTTASTSPLVRPRRYRAVTRLPPTPGDYRRYLLTSWVTYTDWWSVLSPSQPGQCHAVTPILSADSASPRRYGFHMNPGVTKYMGINPTSDTNICSA